MILDNGVIENAIEFAFGRISVRILKKVPVEYYFSNLAHNRGQQGH